MRAIIRFFDKLEDHVRGYLSHYPIVYAFLGGIGIVLFWRGVWITADYFFEPFGIIDGPVTLLFASCLLLVTGLFVSVFIGDQVIISGLRGEKKLTEKTEHEVETEESQLSKIHIEMHGVSKRLAKIDKEGGKKAK